MLCTSLIPSGIIESVASLISVKALRNVSFTSRRAPKPPLPWMAALSTCRFSDPTDEGRGRLNLMTFAVKINMVSRKNSFHPPLKHFD